MKGHIMDGVSLSEGLTADIFEANGRDHFKIDEGAVKRNDLLEIIYP